MNTFGRKFRVSIFGESHGEQIGVVIDGVPAGLELTEDDFINDIARRKSGAKGTTPRIEADKPKIVRGAYEGHTTGAPLTILFANTNTRSTDYSAFADMPRPGHADLVAAMKWDECNDPRGGGHFSGRITLPVVAAGVVAKMILSESTILDETPMGQDPIHARVVELGGIPNEIEEGICKDCQTVLEEAIKAGDSLGAVVECVVPSVGIGYGEPFWDSVESVISHAVFSIPGVRGIEFGDGFDAARMTGSEHNDPIGIDGIPIKNGAGGVNGGITNGAPIVFRVAFKPTSSISAPQKTLNLSTGELDTLKIVGRHDACFALRTPVIVEAMTAIALADLVLLKQ